jgi:hypothetical protein
MTARLSELAWTNIGALEYWALECAGVTAENRVGGIATSQAVIQRARGWCLIGTQNQRFSALIKVLCTVTEIHTCTRGTAENGVGGVATSTTEQPSCARLVPRRFVRFIYDRSSGNRVRQLPEKCPATVRANDPKPPRVTWPVPFGAAPPDDASPPKKLRPDDRPPQYP